MKTRKEERNKRGETTGMNMEGRREKGGRGAEGITLKPLISRRQTESLCQGVTQSEGQGLGVPSQAATEPRGPRLSLMSRALKAFQPGTQMKHLAPHRGTQAKEYHC